MFVFALIIPVRYYSFYLLSEREVRSMKSLKQLLALIMAASLTFCMSAAVLAEETETAEAAAADDTV